MRTERSTRKQRNSLMIKNTFSLPCCKGGTNFALLGGLLNSGQSCQEVLELVVFGQLVSPIVVLHLVF